MHKIRWTPEKVAKFWNFYANNPVYERTYFSYHAGKYLLRYLVRKIPGFMDLKNILDFGCGVGFLIKHFISLYKREAKKDVKIYGLEFSKDAVDRVNDRFSSFDIFGKALYVEKLPSNFNNDFFDLITLVEVLEHLNDKELYETIKEAYRLLRVGGFIVVTVPNEEDLELNEVICPECGCVFHRWQHVRSWSTKSLREFMESNGFVTFHLATCFLGDVYSLIAFEVERILRRNLKYPKVIYIGGKR